MITIDRNSRKKKTAEEFTPPWLVNQILSKFTEYNPSSWDQDKTFCDPACGNGNILVEVLKAKLKKGHDPFKALSTLYGCDIMRDNIRECRIRLLDVLYHAGESITREHVKVVFNQIFHTGLDRYPKGSLDYDFSFPHKASDRDTDAWIDGWIPLRWKPKQKAVKRKLTLVERIRTIRAKV